MSNTIFGRVTVDTANPKRRGSSVAKVAYDLGLSANFVKGEIREGRLRAKRLGRRVVILTEDLEAYLASAELVRPFNRAIGE